MLAAATMLVLGCTREGSTRSDADSGHGTLVGVSWTLALLGTDATLADTEVTLTFTSDTTMAGGSGCNRYFGAVALGQANTIQFEDAGSTMMMCPRPHMEQEGRYLGALRRATSYRVTSDSLILIQDSVPVLTFTRGETVADATSSPR